MSPVVQVFIAAAVTDLATALGVIPFFFVRDLSPRWRGIASAIAGGMMISASVFSLADQALRVGNVWEVVGGLLAGAGFFHYTAKRVSGMNWPIGGLDAADSRRALLIVVAMFIHSIPEGIAIGVGYATGEIRFGALLALAIAVHNIPEGIAITLPLRSKGVSLWTCAGYAVLTSLPQPLAAVPAFLLVQVFQPLLPVGLGFAGGAMIFLVAAELMPDSLEECSRRECAWGTMVGMTAMLLLTSGLGL